MSEEAGSQGEPKQKEWEFRVGVRVDPAEGLLSTGMDEVNGLINRGGKVVSIEGGGAVLRKLNKDDTSDDPVMTLSGCDMKVVIDMTEFGSNAASQEHDRLYQEGLELINPYIFIVGREHEPADTEAARDDLAQGKELFRQALEIDPGNGAAWWIIGKAEQVLEDTEAACDAFRKAYQLIQNNPDAAREYMFECLKLGRTKQAIEAARHARKLKPEDMGLVANLALALMIGGELEEAADTIEIALAGAPDDPINVNLQQRIAEIRAGNQPQPQNLADLDE
ncbi:tetratricopeptide repeat protein [Gimesia algae]|uniref:Tetratricopeptide repeat protein n=1 Tax=Gimesia algae TaxID=2527971 RepID=A0A517V9I6_9PLAN|nr:tetratricopeptide repeat protein [Gimesia algae]QDT89646.1 Tetratricopeptide repeat protein [Gimesia algae]